MKTKKFDCVDLQHHGAEIIKKTILAMTKEEELKYWQDRSQDLRIHQKEIKNNVYKTTFNTGTG